MAGGRPRRARCCFADRPWRLVGGVTVADEGRLCQPGSGPRLSARDGDVETTAAVDSEVWSLLDVPYPSADDPAALKFGIEARPKGVSASASELQFEEGSGGRSRPRYVNLPACRR